MSYVARALVVFILSPTLLWAQPTVVANPSVATAAPAAPANISPVQSAAGTVTPVPSKPPQLSYAQLQRLKLEQEAKIKAMAKTQELRLKQLEQANLQALARNQELQLKTDNQAVQIQVLQNDRSTQMFIYGAMVLALGVLFGFVLTTYIYTKRRRQW